LNMYSSLKRTVSVSSDGSERLVISYFLACVNHLVQGNFPGFANQKVQNSSP
jgi:hypothetical protein